MRADHLFTDIGVLATGLFRSTPFRAAAGVDTPFLSESFTMAKSSLCAYHLPLGARWR